MEGLGIAATQGHRADILGIKWLPSDRNLRLLRVVPAVLRRETREESRGQHRRSVVAVPFLPLGEVHLEAVEAGEVPRGTGERHAYLLVNSPDIPVHPEALAVHRADRLKRIIERVTIARKSRRVVLAANGKGDWPGGKIKQIADKSEVTYGQLKFAGVMQGDVNGLPGRLGVVGMEIQERIECGGWIRI